MKKISILPNNDRKNGWSALLPVRKPNPVLEHAQEADFLVIGAGFTGLAAARRLAELRPQDSIIVLEAEQVGEGAQGRNSGLMMDIPLGIKSAMLSQEQAKARIKLSRAAIQHLNAVVGQHKIDCDWQQDGAYYAAVSPRRIKQSLEPMRNLLASLDEPFEWLADVALHEKLGFKHYQGAIYTPGTIHLNPSALTRGLAENLPHNVQLYEYSPVLSLDLSAGVKVRTPAGSVHAKKLILAVNGFIEQFGFFSGRLMHFAAYASLSAPLSQEQQQALGGQTTWGLTPVNALIGTTARRTNDQRLFIQQSLSYRPDFEFTSEALEGVREQHQHTLETYFPMLSNLALEHTWAGMICLSSNESPGFGRLAPDVYGAVCHNARGITNGTIGGLLAAELACGEQSELLDMMLQLEQPPALLPKPLLGLAVRSRLSWEKWRDRAES